MPTGPSLYEYDTNFYLVKAERNQPIHWLSSRKFIKRIPKCKALQALKIHHSRFHGRQELLIC